MNVNYKNVILDISCNVKYFVTMIYFDYLGIFALLLLRKGLFLVSSVIKTIYFHTLAEQGIFEHTIEVDETIRL
jgi:hypothetical protein